MTDSAKLILVLADQLTFQHPALAQAQAGDVILMAEVNEEATYVRHHQHKLVMVFAAMRHFRQRLRRHGFCVQYYELDADIASIGEAIDHALAAHPQCRSVHISHCGEYRLQTQLAALNDTLPCPVVMHPATGFIAAPETFRQWAEGKKQLRMEYFYRQLRRQTGLLMQDGEPEGGKWNYDSANRKAYKGDPPVPEALAFQPDAITKAVIKMVAAHFDDHPGSVTNFHWPVTKEQAEQLAKHFFDHLLPYFGDYQDAMSQTEQWLFHGRLSAAINLGLLDPLTLCQQAQACYHSGSAPLNAVEGFIRQILGWREYVNGLYWYLMPDYKRRNTLAAKAPLPSFFWDGDTSMNCLAHAINDTLEHGYAHHIQRLMVIGNFSLLAGLSVTAVCDWYLSVYVDAYEWVELPNTLGMALYGDDGVIASKPYCASGKYIQRMSDYCQDCQYNPKTTSEPDSCPFNALYWDFLATHQQRFQGNPRMAMMLKNLDRKSKAERQAISGRASAIREAIIYPNSQQ